MFEYKTCDGSNLKGSVKNRNSALYKLLYYLYVYKNQTKRDICENVFGKVEPDVCVRGWRGAWFALFIKNGLVKITRKNNTVYWNITDEGINLILK